jgi:hypothetical protein
VDDHKDEVMKDAAHLCNRSAVVGAQFGGTTKIWISFKETSRNSTCKETLEQTLKEISPLDGPCRTLCASRLRALKENSSLSGPCRTLCVD